MAREHWAFHLCFSSSEEPQTGAIREPHLAEGKMGCPDLQLEPPGQAPDSPAGFWAAGKDTSQALMWVWVDRMSLKMHPCSLCTTMFGTTEVICQKSLFLLRTVAKLQHPTVNCSRGTNPTLHDLPRQYPLYLVNSSSMLSWLITILDRELEVRLSSPRGKAQPANT